jgi:DNA polymerase III subunit delta'
MPFPSILGHDRVKGLLARALSQGRLPPALLLSGPEGVGKRTLAVEAARGLLCDKGPGEPCNACRTCDRTSRGIHPDLIVVVPETATGFLARETIKIEHIRDAVREILGLPFEARARVVILDNAQCMTEQAMNALLKALEEPPATSHLVLVTASPQALLPTIRSRCQTLRLGPLPSSVLETHLQERLGLPPAEARLRASLSGGSLGAAMAFEADGYRALRDDILAMLEKADGASAVHRLAWSERLAEAEDVMLALTALRSLLRDAAAARAGAPAERMLNADVADRLVALGQGRLAARAVDLADLTEETRTALRGNASRPMSMDVLVDALAG